MNRPAHGVAGEIRIVQRLRGDPLSCKRRVAVHQQRQILCLAVFARAVLLGARAAYRYRINRFKMAGIRCQMDMNFLPAFRDVLTGCADVILHVARTQHAARVHILEFGKHLLSRPFRHVNDHVQPAAMAHAHDQFERAMLSGDIENLVHGRQQRRIALK